jgi:PHD/YefM family antitoxin component YafN of YafNO toxin-antitoxin module
MLMSETIHTGAADAQYVVNSEGERTAVILPIDEYEQLLEDVHDLAVVAERRDEETVSADDVLRRMRGDGLL